MPLSFNEDDLLDRDTLVAEFYNLAFENKGNTNGFITAIENSKSRKCISSISTWRKCIGEKMMYLSSMAHVIENSPNYIAILRVW
jgi:hypothetical protein